MLNIKAEDNLQKMNHKTNNTRIYLNYSSFIIFCQFFRKAPHV